ncbi:MAG: hypothetical protein KKG75_04680 [Nanoarchaeota archaeon]|nr:hypothetical protein [Nanoarchaeota archaeon]
MLKAGRWTKKRVIDEIKNLHEKIGRRPQKRDNGGLYRASREFYGSWNNAMEDLKKLLLILDFETSEIYEDRTCFILRLYMKDVKWIYSTFYQYAENYYPRKKKTLETNTFKNPSLYI